ncbi:MAG TPA: hypothetical protein DCO79_06075 [Spirochaeta sp.]|nr:hypothetical protein [Spirochaeta sp.]
MNKFNSYGETLPVELANNITKIIHEITNGKVNIMGKDGNVISSDDPARINTIHEGGQRIMRGEVDEIAISKEMAESMSGALPGYNGAVTFNGKRICCIGIGGEPEVVKPIQKMAAVIITEELSRDIEQKKRYETVTEISKQIQDISERMGILSLNGSIQAARLGSAGNPFKIVASEMRKLSEEIGRIIISIEVDEE